MHKESQMASNEEKIVELLEDLVNELKDITSELHERNVQADEQSRSRHKFLYTTLGDISESIAHIAQQS